MITRWKRTYCISLLLLVLVIGAIIGIAVGLTKDDDENTDSTTGELEEFAAPIAVVVDRTCEFEQSDTNYLGVTDNGVDNRLSGNAADFDQGNAVIASHNRDGIGAIWALSKNDATGTWGQTPFQTDEEDQFGWDVSIRGNTIVVGAPAFEGMEVVHPTKEDYSWWGGRGAAIVFAKDDNGNWYKQATLIPEVAEDDAGFGVSVDIAECECFIAVG